MPRRYEPWVDLGIPFGDACVTVEGYPIPVLPVSGVTQNIARCPAMVFAAAIINDSPGAVTETSAVPFSEGRYPCGANVQIAFGHGAKEAIGTGIFSLE